MPPYNMTISKFGHTSSWGDGGSRPCVVDEEKHYAYGTGDEGSRKVCSNMLIERGFGTEYSNVPLYVDNKAMSNDIGNRIFCAPITKFMTLRFFFLYTCMRELNKEGNTTIR